MNWELPASDFEEEKEPDQSYLQRKQEQINAHLEKYKDPAKDPTRQAYISLTKTFNDLLITGKTQELAKILLNEDSELFLFSTVRGLPVQYANGPKGFVELYNERKIVEKEVRRVYVDLEKQTTIQICSCKVQYQDDRESLSEEFCLEIFTIQNDKINKYRASYASLTPAHLGEDPFIWSRRDKMLAKVKMINYALADQPDLDKVASLLYEKTEYKILSWDDNTLHTLSRQDFAVEFKNLQNKFVLKCVVPYEVYTDNERSRMEVVISTYAYYFEERTTGKLFVWLSNCVYVFDEDINITRVTQQGELYPEDEVEIPFQVYDREKVLQRTKDFFQNLKPNLDLFYNDSMHFDCAIYRFGPPELPVMRNYHGLEEIKGLLLALGPPKGIMDWLRPIDFYVDIHDPSYEVVIGLIAIQGIKNYEGYKYSGQKMNYLNIVRVTFENGKAKDVVHFFSEIPYPIPSPFDSQISGINFKLKGE